MGFLHQTTSIFRLLLIGIWNSFNMLVAALSVVFHQTADCWIARNIWSPGAFRLLNSEVIVSGAELDTNQNYVFVMNHQSSLDIPAVFLAVKHPLRFVAKKQLLWVPFLGFYLWRVGAILIDRSDPQKAYRSLEAGAEKLKQGLSILVYPEGTRTKDSYIRNFKRGAFVLAQASKIPVVPIAISGTGQIMTPGTYSVRPQAVRIKVGEPIPTDGYSSESESIDLLRKKSREAVIRLFGEIGGVGHKDEDAYNKNVRHPKAPSSSIQKQSLLQSDTSN